LGSAERRLWVWIGLTRETDLRDRATRMMSRAAAVKQLSTHLHQIQHRHQSSASFFPVKRRQRRKPWRKDVYSLYDSNHGTLYNSCYIGFHALTLRRHGCI